MQHESETSRARFPILGVRRAAWGRELRLERRLAVTRSFALGFPDFCCCEGSGDKLPCVDPPPEETQERSRGEGERYSQQEAVSLSAQGEGQSWTCTSGAILRDNHGRTTGRVMFRLIPRRALIGP